MAGHVLDHRHDAFGQKPLGGGAAQRRHGFGPVGIGAVADHGVGLGEGDVEDGQAIDVTADRRHVGRQQARIEQGRFQPVLGVAGIELAQQARRRRLAPVRRPQPRHPAAFLVDQHRRLGARHRGAQLLDQPVGALGRVDVAGKQDEAQRIGVAEEGALVGREVGACAAEDDGSGWGHGPSYSVVPLGESVGSRGLMRESNRRYSPPCTSRSPSKAGDGT